MIQTLGFNALSVICVALGKDLTLFLNQLLIWIIGLLTPTFQIDLSS